MKKVSQIIHNDDIKSWDNNDIITIQAGTGKGKSHFIKNKLYEYASSNNKNILMLVSRSQIKENFSKEIKDKPNITIDTYQRVEAWQRGDIGYDFSAYDYIICDEFHYWLTDDFNKWNDLSFDAVMKAKNKIKLFMSATGDTVKGYFNKLGYRTIDYKLKADYSRINRLRFFYKDETIDGFIQTAIERKEKAIFFIESAEEAVALHKKYPEHTMLNVSEHNRKYYRYVNKRKVSKMLKNNKFDDLILITTRVMDTGVNIVDDELKYMVLDVMNSGNIIQCIGRKRFDPDNENDKLNLFIRGRTRKSLESYRRKIHKKIEMAGNAEFNADEEFLKMYPREEFDTTLVNPIVNKGSINIMVNQLNLYKNEMEAKEIKEMKEKGYCYYISELLEMAGDYKVVEQEQKIDNLSIYLNNVVGEVFLKDEDRQTLIEKINIKNGNNNRLIKSLNTINTHLEDEGYDFRIKKFETSKMINGKKVKFKSAWKVLRLSEK